MRLLAWLNSIMRHATYRSAETVSTPILMSHLNQTNPDPPLKHDGITMRPADVIMKSQHAFIQRIKLSYGSDQETFQKELIPPIQKFVEYVLDLPATPDQHFSACGGMVDLGLRTAFFALQATDDQIFEGRATITARRHLEPRWRQATFIAGLCTELHRTLSHIRVSDEHGVQWQPFLMPLAQWVARCKAKRLVVRWEAGAQETRSVGLFALPMIITPETMTYLAEGNNVVVPHMLASISGSVTRQQHNLLDDLVRRAAAFVIDKDLQESARVQGSLKPALHLGRYFVDTMKDLVDAHPGWAPNGEKSRVWLGPDGLFIIWPNAVTDILKVLEEQLLPGLPQSPGEVLDILLANGIAQPQDDVQLTWLIKPPNVASALEAIKFDSPGILIQGMVPPPLPLSMPLTVASKAARPPRPPATGTGSAAPTQLRPKPPPSHGSKASASVHHLRLAADNTPAAPPAAAPTTSSKNPAASMAPTAEDLFSGIAPGSGSGINLDGIDDMPPGPEVPAAAHADGESMQVQEMEVFSFAVPMRLHPALVKPLADIIHTLNLPAAQMACSTTSTGIFIPLSELSRRQIDMQIAIRSMTELGMLVRQGNTRTATDWPFRGKTVPGVVLKPVFVNGLHPEDFKDAENEE